jgi:hypothetical protein
MNITRAASCAGRFFIFFTSLTIFHAVIRTFTIVGPILGSWTFCVAFPIVVSWQQGKLDAWRIHNPEERFGADSLDVQEDHS